MQMVTKTAELAKLIFDKIELKWKIVATDKEWHFIMIKESICLEDIIITNIYTQNNRALKYMKQSVLPRFIETVSKMVVA